MSGMGTKFLYAKNPIAGNNICKVGCIQFIQNCVLKMDRILVLKSSTESIKRTMLMHEDIFKQQVKELHRLYSVQRKVMVDMKNEMSKIVDPRKNKSMINNISTREIGGLADDQQRETSGCCSGDDSSKTIRGLNLEPMPPDQEGTSNYEDEKISSKLRKNTSDVELTLSIGPSNSKKRFKSHKEKEKSFSTSSNFEEFGNNKPSSNKEAYWFSQDLSLNRR